MLPKNWQRLSDRRLNALRDELANRTPQNDEEDAAIWSAIEDIDDEFALRREDAAEPIDYDQHDRNAAASERIENFLRER
jgi:hypothetical protein